MNESNKTVIYVVVCATVWSIALFSRQDTASNTTSLQEIAAARVGQELFDNFEANNAKRLKVQQVDEKLAATKSFEIERDPLQIYGSSLHEIATRRMLKNKCRMLPHPFQNSSSRISTPWKSLNTASAV